MRYAITGGSGYIGDRLVELLAGREETERVLNLDLRTPAVPWPKSHFEQVDVRDRARLLEILERERPDALVHLAFLLNPIRDEGLMYDIDVNGTHAVLWAAAEAGVRHALVTSSAVAYGAFPDNPRPITEEWPVRGAADFSYARDKADSDRVCQLWAAEHPDAVMTILRPCIVYGPKVENYLSRSWSEARFAVLPDGVDEPFQLVHVDDVVEAVIALLDGRHAGAFNVAADGTIGRREAAEMLGLNVRELKMATARRLLGAAWRLRAPGVETPPGILAFLRYPWQVSNERLKSETGWRPSMDTREVFELTMRAKGKLAATVAAAI
jgi:UDP-glucose 4-epimerase